MSTPSLQKELDVQTFLEQFNLSNQKQTFNHRNSYFLKGFQN